MARRSGSRSSVEPPLSAETPSSTQSQVLRSIDLKLVERLEKDAKFRDRYLRTWAANEVARELREMRLKRSMRQADLAKEAGTGQSAISRIEKRDYDGWTFKTLLTIASVLKARLRIHLEPFEDVLKQYEAFEAGDTARSPVTTDVGTTSNERTVETIELFSNKNVQYSCGCSGKLLMCPIHWAGIMPGKKSVDHLGNENRAHE